LTRSLYTGVTSLQGTDSRALRSHHRRSPVEFDAEAAPDLTLNSGGVGGGVKEEATATRTDTDERGGGGWDSARKKEN
jgi:hypothetical protein